MWARQMAWLGSAVKGADGKPTQVSRVQQIQSDGGTVRLPEVQATHLTTALQGAGMCMAGGMASAPLTATELTAWCSGAGRTLAAWEFSAVLAASRAYVNQLHADEAAPPYGDTSDLSDPEVLSRKFARSLGGLARPIKRATKSPAAPANH